MADLGVSRPSRGGSRYFQDPTGVFHFADFSVMPYNYLDTNPVPVQVDFAVPLFIEGVAKLHRELIASPLYEHREDLGESGGAFKFPIKFGLTNGGHVECLSLGFLHRPQFRGMPVHYTALVMMSIVGNDTTDASAELRFRFKVKCYILDERMVQVTVEVEESEFYNLNFEYFEDVRITFNEVEAEPELSTSLELDLGNCSLDSVDLARMEQHNLTLAIRVVNDGEHMESLPEGLNKDETAVVAVGDQAVNDSEGAAGDV